ncbi:MAG: family 20 glycosylhydrolase [Clostridia bacterium]|nr:family 20 glycosylhydrolase [Clostridia bacterium]
MKIGCLNGAEIGLSPTIFYTRTDGVAPFVPECTENGAVTVPWKVHHATGFELHISFENPIFLSALTLKLGEGSGLEEIAVRSGDDCIGAMRAEREGALVGSLSLPVSHRGRELVLRLIPTLTDTVIEGLELWGAVTDEIALYPTPTRVTQGNEAVHLDSLLSVCTDSHADCVFAAAQYKKLMQSRHRCCVCDGNGLFIAHDAAMPRDGYRLSLTEAGARLVASTRLGLLYGIERLLELMQKEALSCCEIEDMPYKEMRGIHLYLPHRSQLPFVRSLLENMLIPVHYNQIFIEFAGGMRFDSHPEISKGWLEGNRRAKRGEIPPFPHGSVADGELLEKDEVRELCDFARELGFELIPEVQPLGHVQYITYAHPDIAEVDPEQESSVTDAREADIPPSLFYKHSYCPQNEKSYAIIHDLIDEIVEVVRPQRFVHCGHDEIYQLGLCPKCKNVPRDRLYEMHVRDLHDYLAAKGLRMMLWADMVQPVTKYQCYPALDRLPNDIVWLDFVWYFHLDKDIEENLLANDRSVMMGNLYSSHYPRYAQRAAKPGMLGGELSFWAVTAEQALSREGKLFDLMYTAEMLWSQQYCEQARRYYTGLIADRLAGMRNRLREQNPLTVKNALNIKKEQEVLFYNKIKGFYLRKPLEIAVRQTADGLRFLHTTKHREKRIAWGKLTQIGSYTVCYSDGTEIEIPVTYDGNVRCFRYRFAEPLPEPYYRHEGYVCAWDADPVEAGYTEDGTPITLYSLTWHNPHPEKVIASVRCAEQPDSAAGLLLCGIDVMKS